MPKNRIIYYGILILVATVLLWVGAELAKRIEWVLPYTGGMGVALIVGGFIYEWWKTRAHPETPFNSPSAPPKSEPGSEQK